MTIKSLALAASRGFTMIELLIVISILGILAVAVLSAINPIEQINRGRDTGSQSDAEQLISAIDRYHAFNGTYPWQGTATGADTNEDEMVWSEVTITLAGAGCAGAIPCDPVLTELQEKDEIKSGFYDRLDKATNPLYIYNGGETGNSTYVCFLPQSKNFLSKAVDRCVDAAGSGLPTDLVAVAASVCANAEAAEPSAFYCLP